MDHPQYHDAHQSLFRCGDASCMEIAFLSVEIALIKEETVLNKSRFGLSWICAGYISICVKKIYRKRHIL